MRTYHNLFVCVARGACATISLIHGIVALVSARHLTNMSSEGFMQV